MHCIFYLAIIMLIHSPARSIEFNSWREELNHSLSINIKEQCNWEYSNAVSLDDINQSLSASFMVSLVLPSKQEMKLHRSIPTVYSKAHTSLTRLLEGEKMSAWAEEKGLSWMLPVDHPAQNRPYCYAISKSAAEGQVQSLYEEERKKYRAFYLLYARDAFVHLTGAVALDCGYFQGAEGCETRWDAAEKWYRRCKGQMVEAGLPWRALWADPKTASSEEVAVQERCKVFRRLPVQHDRVFVIDALWDFNYHHFIADSIARLSRHIHFLRENSDVKIHIRAFDSLDESRTREQRFIDIATSMRSGVLDLLGIDLSRLVQGPVLAREVFVPRNMRCSYAMSNPMEIRFVFWSVVQYSVMQCVISLILRHIN